MPGSDSLVAQLVKRLPAMRETCVQSLGREDTLEKEMATHSSTHAWKTPWMGEAWWATVHGVAKSWTGLNHFAFTFRVPRGKGGLGQDCWDWFGTGRLGKNKMTQREEKNGEHCEGRGIRRAWGKQEEASRLSGLTDGGCAMCL